MQFDTGLRLEFQPSPVQRAALALVEASLSPEGYALVRQMMRINGFLGEVVDLPKILNEFSYNIALYGTPDSEQPWGWQLYGPHAAVNCLVGDGNMTISPLFLGAEPDQIDEGEYAGSGRPFQRRAELALELMNLLPDDQRAAAVLFHPGDERHLAGAFQDSRVIPFEGTPVAHVARRPSTEPNTSVARLSRHGVHRPAPPLRRRQPLQLACGVRILQRCVQDDRQIRPRRQPHHAGLEAQQPEHRVDHLLADLPGLLDVPPLPRLGELRACRCCAAAPWHGATWPVWSPSR